jgi:hypothetical protein
MKKEKVDLRILKQPGEYSDMYEKLTLQLAREIEMSKNKNYVSVSWESQEQAMDYFNIHGFEKTLSYMLSLRKENEI